MISVQPMVPTVKTNNTIPLPIFRNRDAKMANQAREGSWQKEETTGNDRTEVK